MPAPERKSPRIHAYDYATAGPYLVTICARHRACLFGTVVDDCVLLSDLGAAVARVWIEIPLHFDGVVLDEFVVMPNHVHGIVWLSRAGHAPPLPVVIGSFKAAASRAAGQVLWQRSFHDRVIRDERELHAIRRYVVENPLKCALDRENPFRA
jgi:putative transposase